MPPISLKELRAKERANRTNSPAKMSTLGGKVPASFPTHQQRMPTIPSSDVSGSTERQVAAADAKVTSIRDYLQSRRDESGASVKASESASQFSTRTTATDAEVLTALDTTRKEMKALIKDSQEVKAELQELKELIKNLKTK